MCRALIQQGRAFLKAEKGRKQSNPGEQGRRHPLSPHTLSTKTAPNGALGPWPLRGLRPSHAQLSGHAGLPPGWLFFFGIGMRDAWPRRAKRGRGQVGATSCGSQQTPVLALTLIRQPGGARPHDDRGWCRPHPQALVRDTSPSSSCTNYRAQAAHRPHGQTSSLRHAGGS